MPPACQGAPARAGGPKFRATGQVLGAGSREVELVAITLSPSYRSAALIGAFNRRERLGTVANWLFLSGSLPQLQRVWQEYSVTAYGLSTGSVASRTGRVYVIDRTGHVRQVFHTDPGPGTAATRASFASMLAGAAQQELRSP
jgi:cytochrome oxidase Cu insertion factor (SCO1/SenC/PrrC family)